MLKADMSARLVETLFSMVLEQRAKLPFVRTTYKGKAAFRFVTRVETASVSLDPMFHEILSGSGTNQEKYFAKS
jgi:hypothetical protein